MKSIWKNALAVLLAAVLTVGVSPATGFVGLLASAETVGGTCGENGDNLTWSLDTDTGVLTISGTGDMADYDDGDNAAPWSEYVDAVRSAVIESGVTSIGECAFFFDYLLTSVAIGDDVTRIGENAFTLTALENVHIPASVTEIGAAAFVCLVVSEDEDLTPTIGSFTVDPASESFCAQDGVLYDKDKTTLIQYPCAKADSAFVIPGTVTAIGDAAFMLSIHLQSVTVPDSVTEIGAGAFEQCLFLEGITLGSGLEAVGESAFSECVSLAAVTIPDSVTVIGEEAFNGCESLGALTLGSGLKTIEKNAFKSCTSLASVSIPDSVTNIGSSAFASCESLESVTIGKGVEGIGGFAFSACQNLESVTFNAVACAWMSSSFSGCTGVQTLTIGSNVTLIPAYGFSGMSALSQIDIPNSVTSIGSYAFSGCAFESVHIPSTVTEIGDGAFADCASLAYICSDAANGAAKAYADANGIEFRPCGSGPVDPTAISGVCGAEGDNVVWVLDPDAGTLTISGTGAMADYSYAVDAPWIDYRSSIQSVVIDSGVTTIGSRAFYLCRSLTDVTIAGSVSTIGENAFEWCSSLESLTIPDGVTVIGASAFEGCALSSMFIPRSVTEIGDNAFLCATFSAENEPPVTLYLQSIEVDPENTVYSSQDGILYNKQQTTLILYPFAAETDKFSIPDGVTEIGDGAFRFCTNLQDVSAPNTTRSVGKAAFQNCTALESVTIPGDVKAIGNDAFANCANLVSVSLPDSVTTIGKNAFAQCASLAAFAFPDELTVVDEHAFSGSGLADVTLPDGVAEIAAYAFSNCAKLAFVHIPSSVTAIGSSAFANCTNLGFLCSDTATGLAGTYAAENNIAFRLCAGHESAADTICGVCGAEGDNVLWALNLGNGKMVVSGTGAMDDFTSADDTPWADYRASIQTVIVQDGVTTIGENAFTGCTPLTSVTIGEGVTSVGTGAFSDCALTRVSIPAGVTEIGKDAFACDATLLEIGVDPANTVFASNDGVLYNKAQTELILYPDASLRAAFEIPDTVEEIAAEAFKGAVNLMSIHVPAAVTAIGIDAFAGCNNLEYFCCDETGSYIRSYAAVNGIGFRLCNGHDGQLRIAGDANGDGVVNLKDAVVMRRYLAGGWDVTLLAASADVDGSNSVTLADVTLICRSLAGGWDVVLV